MKTNTPLTGPLYDPRQGGGKRRLVLAGAAALLVAGGLVGVLALSRARSAEQGPAVVAQAPRPRVRAPEGQRIRVEVLNATRTRGLARRATQLLRDGGFDVVQTGTVATPLDSTRVIDRTGHPEWAQLVAKALGGAAVETRIDSSRYLDVTVLLGGSFRPPTDPFYP